MIPFNIISKNIPISDLRRRFGEIENLLPYIDYFILTKKGRPFATLSATVEIKRAVIKKLAGSFGKSDLDSDKIWEEVLKRKSRKEIVKL